MNLINYKLSADDFQSLLYLMITNTIIVSDDFTNNVLNDFACDKVVKYLLVYVICHTHKSKKYNMSLLDFVKNYDTTLLYSLNVSNISNQINMFDCEKIKEIVQTINSDEIAQINDIVVQNFVLHQSKNFVLSQILSNDKLLKKTIDKPVQFVIDFNNYYNDNCTEYYVRSYANLDDFYGKLQNIYQRTI